MFKSPSPLAGAISPGFDVEDSLGAVKSAGRETGRGGGGDDFGGGAGLRGQLVVEPLGAFFEVDGVGAVRWRRGREDGFEGVGGRGVGGPVEGVGLEVEGEGRGQWGEAVFQGDEEAPGGVGVFVTVVAGGDEDTGGAGGEVEAVGEAVEGRGATVAQRHGDKQSGVGDPGEVQEHVEDGGGVGGVGGGGQRINDDDSLDG